MKSSCLLVLFIVASFGAEIYLNPQTDCSTGCDFLSPSTWLNGTIPKDSDDGDNIFIIVDAGKRMEDTIIIGYNLDGYPTGFGINSLIVQNAIMIFDSCSASIYDSIMVTNGQLKLNGTAIDMPDLTSNCSDISIVEDSYLATHTSTTITIDSNIYVYDTSIIDLSNTKLRGQLFSFNSSYLYFKGDLFVYGSLVSESDKRVFVSNALIYNNTKINPGLDATSIEVAEGVTFIVENFLYIKDDLYLSLNSKVEFNNGSNMKGKIEASSINEVYSSGRADFSVNSANLIIGYGNPDISDMSQIALHLSNSSLEFHQLILGQVDSSFENYVFIADSVIFTEDVFIEGDIDVYMNSNVTILNSLGISGKFNLAGGGNLNVYGEINSDVFVANGYTDLRGSISASTHFNYFGEYLTINSSSSIISPIVEFENLYLVLSPKNTLWITGNSSFINSVITVDVQEEQQHPSSSMIQLDGKSSFTTTTLAIKNEKKSGKYNLVNSTFPISGSIKDNQQHHLYKSFSHPSEYQIRFEYTTERVLIGGLKIWEVALIASAGLIIIIAIITIIYKRIKASKNTYQVIQ